MQEILAPEFCPSCNSGLIWKNDQLFCVNQDCGEIKRKSVQHFAKSLKIKGLGPATIEKLDIKDIIEIYELEKERVVQSIGLKLADKLFEEIEKSKKATLNDLIPAFSIPLIGKTAAEKLCQVIDSMHELSEMKCSEAGLGPKATESLMNWFYWEFPDRLIDTFTFKSAPKITTTTNKGVVCISGKLSSFKTKAQAKEELEKAGYIVKDNVTKDVTLLINESGIESSKTKKARDNNVTIITNLKNIL